MRPKNSVHPVVLTYISEVDINGAFQAINPDGLDEACFLLRITNNCESIDVIISHDGVNDHDYLRLGEFMRVYATSNSNDRSGFPKKRIIYVRGAPNQGKGRVYLSAYYRFRGL